MTDDERRSLELRAEIFKALAHPIRLALLARLGERPRCVCELGEELGLEKSIASKHLSQLETAGLVESSRQGTRVEYRLLAPCVLEMASCVEGSVLLNRRRKLGL